MELKFVKYEKRGHIAHITFNRPERMNALHPPCHSEMDQVWDDFIADKAMWVAIVTGAGDKAFSAGNDLRWTAEHRGEAFPAMKGGFAGITARYDIFKPIIAAVNGYAFAAGLETAMLADIRIAAENAEFGALERRWNIVGGDGLTVRLPLIVGFAKAMELIITGRRIDVREAERIGLVNEVVPRGKALERAVALAHEIAALPQGAIRSDKECVLRHVGHNLEERLRIEAEMTISMFMRRDKHSYGAASFKAGNLKPNWPHHGL